MMNREEITDIIIEILKKGHRFLLTTHIDPDGDGIGSMLGLGASLTQAGKEVVLVTQEPLPSPLSLLPGAEHIVQSFPAEARFDGLFVLDCSELNRLGSYRSLVERKETLVSIDHHKTNDSFGDINFVDRKSSSTGELIFQIIRRAGLPLEGVIAENLFAAIQTDTGSFRYENTSADTLRIGAELVELGASPWKISKMVLEGYSVSRLRLLQEALGTLEFYQDGQIGLMTIITRMFEETGARRIDSERFVDYPRFVSGVEISVLIREMDNHGYKFSLRSNNRVDVADLASRFGGGGHARAAGFEGKGPLDTLKRDFLKEAFEFLNGTSS